MFHQKGGSTFVIMTLEKPGFIFFNFCTAVRRNIVYAYTKKHDQPWIFDEEAAYEVDCHVTDTGEVLGIERVAKGSDVGQSGQLVSTEERRTATQTISDRYTDTQVETYRHTDTHSHTVG